MSKDILSVFREIKQVHEAAAQYCLAPDKIPIDIRDLTRAITEAYNVIIVYYLVPLKSEIWKGHIEIWPAPRESPVYINANHNSAESRFTAAKEMAQVILSNSDNRTSDPIALIEEMVIEAQGSLPGDEAIPTPSLAMDAEQLALYVAVELLFPFPLRSAAKDAIKDGTSTIYKTAEWLEIPEYIVGLALTDWYHNFATRVWAEI